MRGFMIGAAMSVLLVTSASAQFTGPTAAGREATVQQALHARVGTYVTLTGQITEHLRGEYFTFRDKSGLIRVEIPSRLWKGRPVSPQTNVRLLGEVERGRAGPYVYIKALEIVK